MNDNVTYIPNRLKNAAKGGYVTGAIDILDDALKRDQQDINADTYRKDETYSKEQLNNLITTPEQQYVTVTADDQTVDVTDVLPATGEADTVYRVGNWDGEQYDPTVYSEYAWDGTQYQFLDKKEYTLATAEDFIKSDAEKRAKIPTVGAVSDVYGTYKDNLEWLRVEKDSHNRVFGGIKRDGTKVIFSDCEIGGDLEVAGKINGNDFTGKGPVQKDAANALSAIHNDEFIEVKKDNAGRIIYAVRENGDLFLGGGTPKQIMDYIRNEQSGLVRDLETLKAKNNDIGDYVQQKKSILCYFTNNEAKEIYYRKRGNVWQTGDLADKVINPVTNWDAADPSYIKAGDYFYLFRTGKPCYIDRSRDLVNWERNYSQVFPNDFDYSELNYSENVECGDLWACDINYVNGQYVLYITVYPIVGGNTNFYDIVMYSESIEGPWTYGGVICPPKSDGGPVTQAVDPEFATDGTNNYLIVGSFFDLAMARLSSDGLSVIDDGWGEGETWKVIASGLPESEDYHDHCGEAAYVFEYKGYYYLFVSLGKFADSTYRIAISRSSSLDEPNFLNKEGESLLEADATVILSSDDGDVLFGPGHNGEIYTDSQGDMYMILHCHVKGLLSDSARPDIIMRIVEEDGWLAFADANGNVVTKPTWECSVPQINE